MEIDVNILSDNWSIAGVVASFLVAGIALWLGIRSSRQLYKMHRVEKRESGIQEIIAWATDVIDFTAGQTTFSAKDLVEIFKSGVSFETVTKTSAHDRHVKLNKLSSKSLYIVSLGFGILLISGELGAILVTCLGNFKLPVWVIT